MEDARITRDAAWPWSAIAVVASAWLLVLFFLKQIVGPLNPDEVYFSHILWLTLEGKRPFLDFYSQHLPAYFWLYEAILPHGPADDLSFVWWVRWSNLTVLAAYAAILFAVAGRSARFYLPLLLLMIVVSRMIEIRSDTFGLLAFNAAWAALLVGKSRRSMTVATLLAIVAVAFSARALVIGLGFGAGLLWLAWLRRDFRALAIPVLLLAWAVGAGVAADLMAPNYVELVIQSTLLSPPGLLSHLSLDQRVLAFDRLPQTLMVFIAMLLGIACVLKRQEMEQAGIIAIACVTQLLLIVFDPSPFPYVYAWAIMPGLAALGLAERVFTIDSRKWAAGAGALCASMVAMAIILYPGITGHQAPAGSNYRLTADAPLDADAIRNMPTTRLVSMILTRDGQESLDNQLRVRSELCGRIKGSVLSAWQSHPICLPDATYYWFSVKWPNISVDWPSSRPEPWFEAMFTDHPPDLFIWDVPGAPVSLNPWAANLLKGYDVERGFAIREDLLTGARDSSGMGAIQRHNDRR